MYTKISSTAKRSFHWMVEEMMALGSWCSWRKKKIAISSEHQYHEPKSVNIFLGFFFLVNYSLGGGFLAIPYSFLYAGYLVAIPTLLVIVFVSWIHASWLLEVMARAQVRWSLLILWRQRKNRRITAALLFWGLTCMQNVMIWWWCAWIHSKAIGTQCSNRLAAYCANTFHVLKSM